MFAGPGAIDDNEKVKVIQNIITLVRAAQKNKINIDYGGIMRSIESMDPTHPEVAELKELLSTLIATNPY